jgi:hypothetical protein
VVPSPASREHWIATPPTRKNYYWR